MFASTEQWWTALRAVSVFNVTVLALVSFWMLRRRHSWPPEVFAVRRLQLLLCAGYVFGCAWRSLLPVYDGQRLVLVDSWWSSVIVGRSVATLAELCFAAQCALLMREAATVAASRPTQFAACLLFPLIVLAECCSWHAVLTTANLGHVIEESLWGLAAVLVALGLLGLWPRVAPSQRHWVAFGCSVAAVYAAYMFAIDVPMYWARWLSDEAQGREYFGLLQGAVDASSRWVVTGRWDVWKTEATWMSLYFSVAVWFSLALVHAPISRTGARSRPDGRASSVTV